MATTDLQAGAAGSTRYARPIVALTAALAPAAVWLIAIGALDREVTVPESPGADAFVDLDLGPVLGASILAVLAGWGLLVVLERVTPKALTIWTAIAAVVLVASLPWNPDFTATERVVIGTMHLLLGLILIGGMRLTSRRPTDEAPAPTPAQA
jgi:hypothetical protein